jgi:hypothetical protein
MSNPGGINLNTTPYYDDYDEDKKFVRVLYRPGRPVQGRELTQSQSIQQKQIERFANYFFKQGSILEGCEQSMDLNLPYVKLQSTFDGIQVNVVDDFENVEIIGANTGIHAYCGIVSDIEGSDPKTLFINYLSSGAIKLTIDTASPTGFVIGNTITFSTGNTAVLDTFDIDPITGNNVIYVTGLVGNPTIAAANTVLANGTIWTMNVLEISDKRESQVFEDGEAIFTKDYTGRAYALALAKDATRLVLNEGLENEVTYTRGSKVTIGDGIMYIADHFIKNTPQTIILDKYSNKPSYKVGLVPTKTFIDSAADNSLVDNAQGTPNFQAPGADRLKIDTVLTKVPLGVQTDETEFISMIEIENGVIRKRKSIAIEGKLEEAIAKRTFEESGNYTLSDPRVTVREHLIQGNNGGRFTTNEGGDTNLLLLEVEPFTSYVKGFRNELIVKSGIPIRKGLDTQFVEQVKTQLVLGSFVRVNEMIGSWDIMSGTEIDLYNTAQRSITNETFAATSPTGTKIGVARVKSVEFLSGTPGLSDAIYNVYLFDIRLNAGEVFQNVRALYDASSPNRLADIVLDSFGNASLRETAYDKLVFSLPYEGIKTLRDLSNNVETGFRFRKEFGVSFSSGVATISTTDNSETFVGNGALTEFQKNANYLVIPNTDVSTSALSGTVSITANTAIVTGSSTQFLTQVNVGDVLTIGGQQKVVASIANATSLTLTTAHVAGATGATYTKLLPAGRPIAMNIFGGTGAARSINVSTPASIVVDIKENASFTGKVVATMDRANAREMRKILTPNSTVNIQANTHPSGLVGPFSLGRADAYQIRAIYDSCLFGQNATTSDLVVTDSYIFDNGQRDNSYEHATIRPKVGVIPEGNLLVVYDHFTHDTTQGVGYLSVDSYPIDDVNDSDTTIDTTQIPKYTSTRTGETFDLRNSIDFRPIKNANTAILNPLDNTAYQTPSGGGGLHIPIPVSDFDADLVYYKGRKAKIFVNHRGELGISDGSPGYPNPIAPPGVPDTLELADIDIPAYPSEPRNVNISTIKNKRYTMKDIGSIQDRVNKLEYYTALNLLEREARDKVVIDDDGIDRFKNGILVDAFTGHNVADVSLPEYKAAIDRSDKYATAYANNEVQVSLKYNPTLSSNSTKSVGNKVMIAYTQEVFEEQPYASLGLNLAQELTFSWVGDVRMVPSTDNWLNTTRDPSKDFVVDLTGQADNWRALVDAWNTEVAPLNRHWVGLGSTTTSSIIGSTTRWNSGMEAFDTQRTVTTNTMAQQIQLANIDIGVSRQNSAVDRVADISINHRMRSRDFIFSATSLKDSTRVYAFFDGINVTANCKQIRLVGNTRPDDLLPLFNNDGILRADNTKWVEVSNGVLRTQGNQIIGIFRVPVNEFNVGQREFKIIDDATNRDSVATTLARTSIFAQGLSIVKAQDVLNTRPFQVAFDSPNLVQTVNRVTTVTETFANVNFRRWDPVAQSFYVDEITYPQGVFLTSIDLYFKSKSANPNLGATVEIREMDNGFPTRKVVGGEVARLASTQINVSSNATVPTTFTFTNPIYLMPGAEYCFTAKPEANSTDFEIWTAELGQFDISNPQVRTRIDKQPASGVVFTSANDSTWSVRQNQDIKFKMNIARFSSAPATIVLQNETFDQPFNYSALTTNIENLTISKTNINYEVRLADDAFILTDFIPVKNLERIIQDQVKTINTANNEVSQNIKSNTVRLTLTTENPYISPYVDLERINLALEAFVVNNRTFTDLTGVVTYESGNNVVIGANTAFSTEIQAGQFVKFGDEFRQVSEISSNTLLTVTTDFITTANAVPFTSNNEEAPSLPYASASRYITRRVALNDGFEASDLNVFVDVNRPAGTNIKVYYRILSESDSDTFDEKFYSEMQLDGEATITQNDRQFTEEKFVIPTEDKIGGAQILFGTVAIANGSPNVVGTSTRFLEEVRIGDTIAVGPSRITKVVSNVVNNTFITVESAYSTTATGQEIFKSLNNVVGYTTPSGLTYSGFKYFSVKVVFLSENPAFAPKIKNLRAIALA